jgi:hypothetical protein
VGAVARGVVEGLEDVGERADAGLVQDPQRHHLGGRRDARDADAVVARRRDDPRDVGAVLVAVGVRGRVGLRRHVVGPSDDVGDEVGVVLVDPAVDDRDRRRGALAREPRLRRVDGRQAPLLRQERVGRGGVAAQVRDGVGDVRVGLERAQGLLGIARAHELGARQAEAADQAHAGVGADDGRRGAALALDDQAVGRVSRRRGGGG